MSTIKEKLDNLETALRESNRELQKEVRNRLTWKERLAMFLIGGIVGTAIVVSLFAVLNML